MTVTSRHLNVVSAAMLLAVLCAFAVSCTPGSRPPTPTLAPSPASSPAAVARFTPEPVATPSPELTPAATPASTAAAASPTANAPVPTATLASPGAGTGHAGSAFPESPLFVVPVAPEPVSPEFPEGPFPTPSPLPQPRSNLVPRNAGLTLLGAEESGVFRPENLTVSWWVANSGPQATSEEFKIEIRFDGTVIGRWTAQGLSTKSFIFVEDQAGLLDGIDVSAGIHEISLVIDPLDRVVETSETDNVRTRSVTFVASEPSTTPAAFLPNLTVIPAEGKREVIFASSHPDDPLSGKLTIDHPTHVISTATNASIQYVPDVVELDLYLDDTLVQRLTWDGVGARETVRLAIDDLAELVSVPPGPHTLRVEVDPANRIRESDENDNSFEVELIWGVGDPEPASEPFVLIAPIRQTLTRANLAPFRPFGWDAAITASVDNLLTPVGSDGWLEIDKTVRIDLAFTNASRFSLPLTDQLSADVLLDGQVIERVRFQSGSSNVGVYWQASVRVAAGSLLPGEHMVRVVLDPDGLFDELDESDNVFERSFEWHENPDPNPDPEFVMSEPEISAALAPVFNDWRYDVKPAFVPGDNGHDLSSDVRAAGRAAYYLLTGRDVEQEGYVLHFLPHDDFYARSVSACMSGWITMSESEYLQNFERCTADRSEIGFKARENGQIHIFVDLGLSPMDALGTYLHELGHGLQDLRNPDQAEIGRTLPVKGLFEAQAQLFEAAGWRAIEEFAGQSLSLYPDVIPARDRFEFLLDSRLHGTGEHDVGYRLIWAAVLSGSGMPGVSDRVRSGEVLDAATVMLVYHWFVNLLSFQAEAWVTEMLSQEELVGEYAAIAAQRFVETLDSELTGHPALQDSTWTVP